MARYSDEFRASAIIMLEAAGWPERKGALTQVARQLGLKHQTLGNWARRVQNPPPQKLLHVKGFDILAALKDELAAIFGELPTARPDADFKELATAAAIFIDKVQLLEGKATERVEHLTVEERTERITDLLDSARNRRTGLTAQERVQ